jgi:ATP phosphoribosyltransferase
MLRVAVPNKGSLSLDAADMLKEAGYRQRRDVKELVLTDTEHGVEFFYLRPHDIAVYVAAGTLAVICCSTRGFPPRR